jgi:hypothetical protein
MITIVSTLLGLGRTLMHRTVEMGKFFWEGRKNGGELDRHTYLDIYFHSFFSQAQMAKLVRG